VLDLRFIVSANLLHVYTYVYIYIYIYVCVCVCVITVVRTITCNGTLCSVW
jgi:hypothetical protein